MITTLVTAPTTEPISIEAAKIHLRVTQSDDDAYILSLIKAARKYTEDFLSRALITQTWDMWIDQFPYSDDAVLIAKPPTQSVSSITYVDTAGATQTLSSAVYTADTDSQPARVYLAHNQTWPDIRTQRKAVKIRFVAGYGDDEADVPQQIIQAMLLLISHFYEIREPVVTGTIATQIPMSVEFLLTPYRMVYL